MDDRTCVPWPCAPGRICAHHAPRISAADAGPLIALFREARENPVIERPIPHVVYRFYDAEDVLLYVGMTSNFKSRHRAHELRSPWYGFVARHTTEDAESEDAARAVEWEAIGAEAPVFNGTRPGTGHDERRAAYLARASLPLLLALCCYFRRDLDVSK